MIPVLVVGAGPTGLILALWLKRLGVTVRIIDRNSGPADFSRALGVQARTLELYQMLGIAEDVIHGGVHVRGANLWVAGKHIAQIPLSNIGQGMTRFPFVIDYAQNDHERMLIRYLQAEGTIVERDTELTGFTQSADRVTAIVRNTATGSEETIEARFIAGCDGAHSRVRETLGIDFPGGTYEQLFYVADVDAVRDQANDQIHIDLATADLLALFPMKGPDHVRLVGTVVGRQAEGMTFDNAARQPIDQMRVDVKRVNWFSPYRVHHRVASHFRDKNAFILGDAAHIHSPVGAQGMNTGIGDAVNLAWKIAESLRLEAAGEIATARALIDTYEPERIAFARRLVATTDRAFTLAMRRGRIAQFVRTRVFPQFMARFIEVGPTRRFAFRTISQLGLQYRESKLSTGRAGSLRAGDRLPWVDKPSGDNYAPLKSLTWQIHVYGTCPEAADLARKNGVQYNAIAWDDKCAAVGLQEDAVYIIRPDGYIGFAGDAPGAAIYLDSWNIGLN